jgi:HK97 family phage portal protein
VKIPFFSSKEAPAPPAPDTRQKSLDIFDIPNIFSMASGLGIDNLAAAAALRYYVTIAPVATAVDKLIIAAGQVSPVVKDKKDYQDSHRLAEFLEDPNSSEGWSEFSRSMILNYVVTGAAYLECARAGSKILSAKVISSGRVSFTQSGAGGPLDGEYRVSSARGDQVTYKPAVEQGEVRWLSNGNELIPILGTVIDDTKTRVPVSPLASVYMEIEQYKQSNIHNKAALVNGLSPSLILTTADNVMLSQEQMDDIRAELRKYHSGPENANKALLLDGVQPWSTSTPANNKDMEFMGLRKDMVATIYNRLRMPLPLVTLDKMTLNNFDSARVEVYDSAVLPLLGELFAVLQRTLGSRFGMRKGDRLTYDPDTIPALQTRRLYEAKAASDLGALSINEIRAIVGYETIGEEGDVIVARAGAAPLGEDKDTDSNRDEPADKNAGILDFYSAAVSATTEAS